MTSSGKQLGRVKKGPLSLRSKDFVLGLEPNCYCDLLTQSSTPPVSVAW